MGGYIEWPSIDRNHKLIIWKTKDMKENEIEKMLVTTDDNVVGVTMTEIWYS